MTHGVASGRDAVRVVDFDTAKHGRYLLADAGAADELPGFITSDEPHRLSFYEIALIEEGRGHLELDGEAVGVHPSRVIITAAGETRRWRLARSRLRAQLAFFTSGALDDLVGRRPVDHAFPGLAAARSARAITLPRRDFDELGRLVAAMRAEIGAIRADSATVLRAQLLHLLVLLQRHCAGATATSVDAAADLARRFTALVETGFPQGGGVARYAEALGISRRHLNACVRRTTGRTAQCVLHDRRLLEAQRRLSASCEPVTAIAEALGFSDPSYFVRFFRRRTGATPAAFRRSRGSPIVDRQSD